MTPTTEMESQNGILAIVKAALETGGTNVGLQMSTSHTSQVLEWITFWLLVVRQLRSPWSTAPTLHETPTLFVGILSRGKDKMPGISDKQQKDEGRSVHRLYVPQSDSHSARFVECLRTRSLLRYLTVLWVCESSQRLRCFLKQIQSQDVEGYWSIW